MSEKDYFRKELYKQAEKQTLVTQLLESSPLGT